MSGATAADNSEDIERENFSYYEYRVGWKTMTDTRWTNVCVEKCAVISVRYQRVVSLDSQVGGATLMSN